MKFINNLDKGFISKLKDGREFDDIIVEFGNDYNQKFPKN